MDQTRLEEKIDKGFLTLGKQMEERVFKQVDSLIKSVSNYRTEVKSLSDNVIVLSGKLTTVTEDIDGNKHKKGLEKRVKKNEDILEKEVFKISNIWEAVPKILGIGIIIAFVIMLVLGLIDQESAKEWIFRVLN